MATWEKLHPRFIAEHDIVQYGMCLWSVWVSCLYCVPLPKLFLPYYNLLTGAAERASKAASTLCKHCSPTAPTMVIINPVSITSLKHSTVATTTKKISSIPTKPHTLSLLNYTTALLNPNREDARQREEFEWFREFRRGAVVAAFVSVTGWGVKSNS